MDKERNSLVMAVHSTFGERHAFGVRAWRIAEAAGDRYEFAVLARSVKREIAGGYAVTQLGPGRVGAYALKRLRRMLPEAVPVPLVQDLMEGAALRYARGRGPENIDIFHSWPFLPKTYAYLKERNQDCRIIQDLSMEPAPENRLFRESVASADIVTVPSLHIRGRVLAMGVPESKLRVVPFGVDAEAFRPLPTRDYEGTFRVAFAGRLEPRKGVLDLIDAWKSLGLRDAELHLYGGSTEAARRHLTDPARHGIVVHGFVDLPRELPKNLVFALPSSMEGSAKAIYEALACGLPVITTANAGSVVRDGEEGFIIDEGRPDLIAEKLRYYYERREELSVASRKARERALDFSWERYAKAVLGIYSEENRDP